MSLDPRIPLGVQPLQIQSPLEVMSTVAQLQGVREQAEARRLAAEEARTRATEAREKRAKAEQVDAALRDSITIGSDGEITIDPAKVMAHLPDLGGAAALALQETIHDNATKANAARKSQAELFQAHQGLYGSLAQRAYNSGGDPAIWTNVVDTVHELQQSLPAKLRTMDDATHQRLRAITDPQEILRLAKGYMEAAVQDKLEKIETVDAQGRPVTQFVRPTAGASYPTAPKVAAGATVGSFEDYVARDAAQRGKPIETYTTADIDKLREKYRLDQRPSITVNTGGGSADDVKQIVQGMIDGTLPPELPGRASPVRNAILAEAKRRGFNLVGAVVDWTATQKHIATMNGAQQLRLNQAVNALPEMLDSVATLAQKWKAGRFPLLNRANLAAAKGGVYGREAATIANQLDAQIADVVADLGNVYMGGNSPTDHALSLAGKSLSADWDEKVLLDMVALAKKNVQIRRNSINNTGVAGASADNPYMPAPPPVADQRIGTTVTYNGKQYKVVGVTPAGKLQLAPLQ